MGDIVNIESVLHTANVTALLLAEHKQISTNEIVNVLGCYCHLDYMQVSRPTVYTDDFSHVKDLPRQNI